MEEKFKVFDYMLDGVVLINENKEVIYINVFASMMTKLKPRSVIGKKSYENLVFSDENLFCMKDGTIGKEKTSQYQELSLTTSKGASLEVQMYIQPINIIEGNSLWMIYFHNVVDEINLSNSLRNEIDERKKTTDQIIKVQSEAQKFSELAFKDNMTGLGNFRYFQKEVLSSIESTINNKNSFCLVMIDVDKFKSFNDTYGHQQGDEVLRCIAQAISNAIRSTDIVARYGGEEFVMIFNNSNISALERICENVRQSVEKTRVPKLNSQGDFLSVTVSLGGVSVDSSILITQGITSYEPLLEVADKNLYVAKNSGRNKTIVSIFGASRSE